MGYSARATTLVLFAAVAATAVASAPALAAPIADGTIFTTQWGGGQLYTSSAATGALATVGDPSAVNWISGIDIDGASGEGFAVTYVTDPEVENGPSGPAALYEVDATSGAIVLLHSLTLGGEPVEHCLDLDYTNGQILVACDIDATSSWLGTVDPATGVATAIVPTMDRTQAIARLGATVIAFGFEGVVNSVDLATTAVTPLGLIATSGLYPAGADFDAAGVLYVSSAASMEPYNLYTVDPVSLTGELIGPMGLDGVDVGAGNDVSVTGILPLPADAAPTLASTGIDAAPLVTTALLALIVLAVGTLLVRRRSA